MARWDKDMDEMLREGVLRYGANWECVSTHMTPHVTSKEEVEKRCAATSRLLARPSIIAANS